MIKEQQLIYLDNNSTTRLDGDVLNAMMPFLTGQYGNPASQHHFGLELKNIIEQARERIATYIGASSAEVVFTSGATEGINIALKGLAFEAAEGRNKIVTVATEHRAVLDTCAYLEQIGFEIVFIPVDNSGLVSYADAESIIDEQTLAVSVMLVNNETGVIQPVAELAQIAHGHGAIMITDATQAMGKISVDVGQLGVDVLIFSAHKFHGPKGIGGLYLKRGLKLSQVVHGGGHERGLRGGTSNVPGIAGMAKALEMAAINLEQNSAQIRHLRDTLELQLLALPGATLNGHPDLRVPNVANISFDKIDANTFISEMTELAISNGSACTSAVLEPSHVLSAMGITNESAFGAIRFSLSKYTTLEEVNQVSDMIKRYIERT